MKENLFSKEKASLLKLKLQKSTTAGISIGNRLFLLLIVFVLTIILGIIAILFITGVFNSGLLESKEIVQNELTYASEEITQQYGQFSKHVIKFSEEMSKGVEKKADELGISLSDLEDHPEVLEEIISSLFDQTLLNLQISKSSGAFLILNATVNPNLDNAADSRAGLYIKNMEPNIINSSSPTITILRGFPSISRNNSLGLHAQWKMEFDVSDAPYYHRPIVEANLQKGLPLSRLYYWSTAFVFPDTSEKIMLCSAPLIDSNNNVIGVSGLEVSSMLFKLSYAPVNQEFKRLFYVLSPTNNESIDLKQSMLAGNYFARLRSKNNSELNIFENKNSFYTYSQNKENSYWGMHKPIKLYPKDSVFYDEQWVVGVMMPEKDIRASVAQPNLIIFFLLILLFALGVIASFFLSKNFTRPISRSLQAIKASDFGNIPKTRVVEIDDLIDFLSVPIDRNEKTPEKSDDFSLSMLNEFIENVKKLSPAERSVFNLYVEGHTAKEIVEILYLSINTIKTHNKRIYSKLNVSSREELLVYINMLKELGKDFS